MKKIFSLLLAGIMVFSFVGCNSKSDPDGATEGEEGTVDTAEKDFIVMHYGYDAEYEEYEAVIHCPEGAYFDEDDYAEFEEDGYMYTFTVSDDEKEYTAYANNYFNREAYDNKPIGYDVPQQLFFDGELDEETLAETAEYSQDVIDLGFQWEGKDVILIKTEYSTVDEWDYNEVFVGVEYDHYYWNVDEEAGEVGDFVTNGLVGFEISYSGWDELTVDQYAWIAGSLFGVDSGKEWPEAAE